MNKCAQTIGIRPPDQSTEMQVQLPDLTPGRYGLHLIFDCRLYPLRRHCCHMRPSDPQSDPQGLRRFAEMTFSLQPPGLCIGPWPGWRGVPPMPEVKLTTPHESVRAQFNFYGDEEQSGLLRAIALLFVRAPEDHKLWLQWSDDRLLPLRIEIIPNARRRAEPTPVDLVTDRRGGYPRLLFTAEQFTELRKDSASAHRKIKRQLLRLERNRYLPDEVTAEAKLLPGPERLRDFDRLLLPAFLTLFDSDAALRHRAIEQLVHALDLSLQPDYEPMVIDTQSGECLFSLCLAVDWLWNYMDDSLRGSVREKLYQTADRVWRHIGYEREDYAQAHFLGAGHGLLAFCFLFWETHPQVAEWAAWLHGAFLRVLDMLPDDGFYPHGLNLWIYEHAFLLRFLELLRGCAGLDYWSATPYWRKASCFRAAATSDNGLLGVTFGDPQYRVGGDSWMHRLIALRTASPAAANLAAKLIDLSPAGVDFRNAPARRRIWEFLYSGKTPAPAAAPSRKAADFPDGGQLFWRSSCYLVTLRAGAPLGEKRYQAGEWSGYGHSDPGQGSFLIADDRGLLVCGPGPVYRRDTLLHNTVTFNGYGQIGDRMVWAPDFIAADRFSCLVGHGELENGFYAETDLAPAYLDFLAVKRLRRKVIWLPPGLLIVQDTVECTDEKEVQWNLHSYHPWHLCRRGAKHEVAACGFGKRRLQVWCLSPELTAARRGLSDFVPAYPHAGERDYFLQLGHKGQKCRFVVVLAWAAQAESLTVDGSGQHLSGYYDHREFTVQL